MSSGHYLIAVVLLGVLVGSLTITGSRVRRMLLPSWSGPPARVAEAIVGLAVMILLAELLGSIGAFKRWPLVLASLVVALTAVLVQRRVGARATGPSEDRARAVRAPHGGAGSVAVATVAAAVALTRSMQAALDSLHGGMRSFDTLWYHMPFAARFVQDASLTRLHYVGNAPTTFYPANSELVHAIGIILFRSDVLSPILNVAWLGLALLAGWCVGRPSGVAPATMTAVALASFLPVMGGSEAGTASNDTVALALLVAAVAMLIQGRGSLASIALVALAAGLAAGTKLNLWSSVVALGVVVVAAAHGHRFDTGLRWIGGVAIGSAFWYIRNWVAVGNPFPWFGGRVGGLFTLPTTTAPVDCGRTSVAHYLANPTFVSAHFLPQLRMAMGSEWWVVLGLAGAGIIIGLLSPRTTMARGLAVVALVSGAAYLVTPATAGGDNAGCFAFNTRFAVPALALGMILLPLVLVRWQRGPLLAVLVFALTLVLTIRVPHDFQPVLVAVVLVAAVCIVGFGAWRTLPRPALAVVLVALGLLVTLTGWHEQRVYLRSRYAAPSFGQPIEAASRLLSRVHGARVAVTGFAENYPFYGSDLSNRVEYPARREGARFFPYSTCRDWLLALSRGQYSYVVTARGGRIDPAAAAWTRRYPGARELISSAPGKVRHGERWQWQLFQLDPSRHVNPKTACASVRSER
jgi:hypothetical protein